MSKKFACMEFVKTLDEIPLRFKILKKAPPAVLDWYVKKFNPFVMEDMSIAGEMGYRVKLPVYEQDVAQKEELTVYVMEKTIETLKDYNVEMFLPPKGYPYGLVQGVLYAQSGLMFTLCITDAVAKAVKMMRINMKTAEFLIICGEEGLTRSVLDSLYPEVNFLTIIDTRDIMEDEDIFSRDCEAIFADTGLNVHVCGMNKNALESADIIINTTARYTGSDYVFKRGSVFFDLSCDATHCAELARKREDMLVVNDLRVKYDGEILPLKLFSMACFLKNSNFRRLTYKGYEQQTSRRVMGDMSQLNYSVISFGLNDLVLNSSRIVKILERAGGGSSVRIRQFPANARIDNNNE